MQRCGSVWSTSPAVALAFALATGIWWSDRSGIHPRTAYFTLAVFVILALPLLRRSVQRPVVARPLLRAVLALCLAFTCGALRSGVSAPPLAAAGTSRGDTPEFAIEGRVARTTRSTSGRTRTLLEDLRSADGRGLRGSLLVYLPEHVPNPPVGAMVGMPVRLMPFPRPRNPGEFDYGRFLARRGIHTVVRAIDTLDVIHPPGHLARVTASARQFVMNTLEEHVPTDRSRILLRALLLGDRSELTPDVRESFIVTGLVHVLAVSGLHVMIVGLLLYRLAGPLLMRMRLRWSLVEPLKTGLTLLLLIGYAALTGRPTSVVRAVTMTAVLLLSPVVRRRRSSINGLGVAAVFILWTRPYSLFEPGFQLSVSAVGGILLLVPRIQYVVQGIGGGYLRAGPITDGIFVSAAATLATLPVLLIHFGRASFAGIALNVLAIPLTAAALCASILCLIFAPLPPAAYAFGTAADACIRLLIELASQGSTLLSGLAIDMKAGPVFLILFSSGLVSLLYIESRGPLIRTAAATLVVLSLVRAHTLFVSDPMRVLFLDVGQGDATLIRTPSGKCLLVDAGPADERFDTGVRIILPYLNRQAIGRVDALVLTHNHVDHVGGASSILRRVDVGRLVVTGTTHGSRSMDRLLHVADSAGVAKSLVRRGDTLLLDPEVRIYVLGPSETALSSADENDRSIILRVEYSASSILLMGDAEGLSELDLAMRYGEMLPAGVIKVGHHGSSTSSQAKFVSMVSGAESSNPWAVVSVARRNRYGHPSAAVLSRWEAAGAQALTTAEDGAVLFEIDRRGVRRVDWRQGGASY